MEEKHMWRILFIVCIISGYVMGEIPEELEGTIVNEIKLWVDVVDINSEISDDVKDTIAINTYYNLQNQIDYAPCYAALNSCISNISMTK